MGYDKRSVGGGMNMDDAFEVIPNGQVRFRKNMHLRENGKSDNVKGNTLVSTIDIPLSTTATYKCIGAKEDPISNTVIYFLHSSDLDHRILQYQNKTNSIATILIEQPGSFLNFDTGFLITGINIIYIDVNNPLLYWTDDKNRPRELNIEAAKLFTSGDFTGYYSSPFLETFIDAIKYPPLYPPTFVYDTDTSKITNNLKNIMRQFKYRFVYFNNQRSAFSPISDITLADQYSNLYLQPIADDLANNVLKVSGVQGASNVVKIEIAFREGNLGDFYLIAVLDRAIATATDAPFTYSFYNDQVKIPIEINESNKLFDNLPQLAKAQEFVDGNHLVYGNIVEGYDNVAIDVELTPVYNARPELDTKIIVPMTRTLETEIGDAWVVSTINADRNDQDGVLIHITFDFSAIASINVGDIVTIHFKYSYTLSKSDAFDRSTTWVYPYARTEQNGDTILAQTEVRSTDGSIADVIDRLVLYLNNRYGYLNDYYKVAESEADADMYTFPYRIRNAGSGEEDTSQGMRRFKRVGSDTLVMADSTHDPSQKFPGTTTNYITNGNLTSINTGCSIITPSSTNNLSGFKAGAQHQFGIVYYDNANRSGGANIGDSSVVEVEWYDTSSNSGKVDIDWAVKQLPPDWAVKWGWVYSGNNTVNSFHQFAVTGHKNIGAFGFDTQVSRKYADALLVSYQEIKDYADAVSTANGILLSDSGLGYVFTPGDRLRVIGSYDNTTGLYTAPTSNTDVEIIGTETIDNTNYLVIRSTDETATFEMEGLIVEVYNTKINSNAKIYYEFGDQYPILNAGLSNRSHGGQTQDQDPNQPSTVPAEGTFTQGDIYFKPRLVIGEYGTSIVFVEDYYWLDYAPTKNYNKGRPSRALDGKQQSRKSTTITYSGQFIENTSINNLNNFNADLANFEDYEQKYGSIQKLAARERDLLCFQELKVGEIGINERTVANENAPIEGQTDKVLNPIKYYAGEYGIGKNPESWARFGFADYFVDVYRGMIMRLSTDGMTALSFVYKMNDYTTSKFAQISGQSRRINLYGVFNKRRMQYELAIEGVGSITSETLAFDEKNNCFSSFYDYLPEFMCGSNQDMVSFVNGRLWFHDTNALRNNFYGVQYNSEIWVVGNDQPSEEKVFQAISEESNSVWEVYEFTNNKGQLSNLIGTDANLGDFELNEGIYYAALLRDSTTPNVINPLINGDDMRDVIIVAKMRNVSTGHVSIFAVNFNSAYSPRSNN